MAEIRLYGKLRRLVPAVPKTQDHIVYVSPKPRETLEMLLARMEIPLDEIYTIFFNAKLLATRSAMAKWMGYPQVRPDPFDWRLNIPVNPNDRVGLFGRDMAALVI